MSCGNNQQSQSRQSQRVASRGPSRLVAASGVSLASLGLAKSTSSAQFASASASAAPVASAFASSGLARSATSAQFSSVSRQASQRAPSQQALSQRAASQAAPVASALVVRAPTAASQRAASQAAPVASSLVVRAPTVVSQRPASRVASQRPASQAVAYVSQLETALLNATNPLSSNETEEITVNGETGYFLNKAEVAGFRGQVPLEKYPINQDPCPQVIKKKAQNAELVQDLSIKYLKPKLQVPGPITIRQEANKNVAPAPPVIIRQQPKPACGGGNKVFREAPPCLPKAPGPKEIVIPGKLNPAPPRKVIIEKLAGFPAKPESISVERWVEPEPVKRQVKFIPAPKSACVPKPRNVIIEWEAGQVSVKENLKNLGVSDADASEYRRTHNDLVQASQLPAFAQKAACGVKLAANNPNLRNQFYELEGDVQALGLVDLDKENLGEYREYLQKLGVAFKGNNNASATDDSVQYCPDNCPCAAPSPKPDPCACN